MMNRRRRKHSRSSMGSDTAAHSLENPPPPDLSELSVSDVDTAPPFPKSFSPPPPPSCPPEEGLAASPHSFRARSVSSRTPSPQATDPVLLRSTSQSPNLPSLKNSTVDLRMMDFPSRVSLPPSVPGSPSWIRPKLVSDNPMPHNDYYLEDGVIFLAENTLFKVPRYMLNKESEVFPRLYSAQFEQGGCGSSDLHPIILEAVEATDFQRLLTVLYPRSISLAAIPTERWTELEWESVLLLAAMWQMPQVRLLAIDKISSCGSSMTKIFLGKRYDIPRWIRAGFLDLCLRDGPLTDEEGSLLGWKDILKISRAREMIRSKVLSIDRHQEWEYTKYGNCAVYATSYDPSKYTRNIMVHHILDETFGLEDLAPDLGSNSRPCSRRSSRAHSIRSVW